MLASDNLGSARKQRKFLRSWLNEFPYIDEVPGKDDRFLCTICNQEFAVVNKKRLQKHIDSQKHQKMQNNEINEFQRKEKGDASRKFLPKWLEDIRFKFWLQMVPTDQTKFRCILCDVEKSCASGVSNLVRHAEGLDHIAICNERGIETLEDLPAEVIFESMQSFEDRKKAREIEFAHLGCTENIPYRTMPKVLKFFQKTDPKILQHMTAGAAKVSGIVRNVLGPVEESRLIEILRETTFSVYVDETTDPNGTKKWMTFLVSFVDCESLDRMTELTKLMELDSTNLSADGIFAIFKKYITENKIPFSNILALSTDNATVMIGENYSFKTLILKENPEIIIIPCICHRLALAAKDACNKAIPSFIDTFLQAIVHHMNSTKRSEAFEQFTQSYQGTSNKILNYAKTRWLGRHDCIKRIRELYDSLVPYFKELCFTEKSNKTFLEIKEQLEDPKTRAYLAVLEHILFEFNKINLFFQHSETRVHLLCSKSFQFLQIIARHFLKAPLLKLLDSESINFSLPCNQKPIEDISFGPDCNDILEELSRNTDANADIIREIRQNCLSFLIEAASQISSRLYYMRDEFFQKLSVFDAYQVLMDSDRDTSFLDILYFAKKLGDFNKDALKAEWRLVYRDFSSRPELDMRSFDEMWKIILSNRYADGNAKYPQLTKLVGYIRSLPHANAAAERSFSMLPDISTKKRNRLSAVSLNAIAVVKSAAQQNEKTARSATVSDDHLSRMSSDKLYEPPKKRMSALSLHAGTNGE